MNKLSQSVAGVVLAAGAMYFFDPVSGHRRRLILRDGLTRTAQRLEHGTRRTRNDLSHRAHDLAVRFTPDRPSDTTVSSGIRDVLKSTIAHPKAIAVAVHEGHVVLRGDVFTHELDDLLEAVRSVPGVRVVTDHLTARERAESIHSGAANGWPLGILLGATGCGLLAWGIKERKALGAWGQELWRESKRELDEVLAEARRASEGQRPLDRAAEVADDLVDTAAQAVEAAADAEMPGRAKPNRNNGDRPGGSHAQVA